MDILCIEMNLFMMMNKLHIFTPRLRMISLVFLDDTLLSSFCNICARDTNGSESKVVKRSCDIDAGHAGQITMLQLSWEEDACIRSLQAVYGSDKVGDIHRTGYIFGSDEDTEKEKIPVESKIVKIVTMHEKSTGSLTSIEVSTIFRGLSKY